MKQQTSNKFAEKIPFRKHPKEENPLYHTSLRVDLPKQIWKIKKGVYSAEIFPPPSMSPPYTCFQMFCEPFRFKMCSRVLLLLTYQNGGKVYVMSGQLTVSVYIFIYTVTNLKIFTEFLMQQRNRPATRKSCVLAPPYFASTCIFVLLVDFAQSWAASCSHPPGCRVMMIDDGLERVVQSKTYLHCNPEGQNLRQNLSG